MRDKSLNLLRQELRQAGASQPEAAELSALAAKLPLLKDYKHIKDEGLKHEGHRYGLLKPFVGVVSLALVVFLILAAQAVLPTSWLYPVQKFSDSVAIDVHPQYRASVMMKRAQQVNALVKNHASSNKILATLDDYTNQARVYKTMPHANYAAFEFCKTNLQQAASAAPPAVKQAIQSSLQSLETT